MAFVITVVRCVNYVRDGRDLLHDYGVLGDNGLCTSHYVNDICNFRDDCAIHYP